MKKLTVTILIIGLFVILNITPGFAEVFDPIDMGFTYDTTTYKNSTIFTRKNIDTKQQVLTSNDIIKVLEEIPDYFYDGVDIYLLDIANPAGSMTLGTYKVNKNIIVIWANSKFEGLVWLKPYYDNETKDELIIMHEQIKYLMIHEIGHAVENKVGLSYREKMVDLNEYTFVENEAEDFAVTFTQYLLDPWTLKQKCPKKYYFFFNIEKKVSTSWLQENYPALSNLFHPIIF